ncbi:MAG TPA: glycoside hydrolase family 2 TIM barrel-domain containing protein [Acidisarcina sp.]|nr:glycoside hydrolase family 2 TIM barrel-domain containing protein [Acidisarcina sp.]
MMKRGLSTSIVRFSLVIFLLGFGLSPRMRAQSVPSEIENEQLLGINKQPYHATLMPYPDRAEAVKANRMASTWARSLNGLWKFHWVPRPEERPADFYKTSFDVSTWKTIPVPSNMEVEGYGTPFYRNNGYTFQKDWPRVMSEPPKNFTAYKERNPVGSYRRDFEVPAAWNGQRIFLTFSGVDSAFFLWVNGEKVGFSVNSRNPAEFDITPYVKVGQKNMVAIEVYRYSAGSYLEDQDMWRLSGIFRNVTLWSAPQVHIRDFAVTTELDSQYRDAVLKVSAKIHNFSDADTTPRQLTVELTTKAGKAIPGAAAMVAVPALKGGEEKEVSVSIPVTNPEKWTAETPNLYTTVLKLQEGKSTAEYLSSRTGFRKIEIKDAVFIVNGVPVKLKGADRHENWPDTGHYVTDERMVRDLELLKQVNANHVRTSHYTDDPRWYELADEYGIYLVAEANVECHGYYGVLDHEPRFEKAIVDRNVANVENLKNHASVVIWSLGNECGGGSNFRSALNAVKQLDSTRLTHYEPFGGGEKLPADIESHMYTNVADLEKAARDSNRTKPFYLCEYAHAMNNSMGSVGEYNDLFDKYPKLMGGAIWEWEDQGLWNRRDPKHPFLAYGGGFGEVPNDHYFIHKGVVFSDRTLKPHYPELKRVYQWVSFDAQDVAAGKFQIRNRYAFTNLNQFLASWTLSQDGSVIQHGSLGQLDVAPATTRDVTVPFAKFVARPGREYFLQLSFKLAKDELWAKAGYEVATAQFQLPVESTSTAMTPAPGKPLHLIQDAKLITVEGDGFKVVFDRSQGAISQLVRDGVPLLVPNGGPQLYLWRAPHRNDDQWAAKDWQAYGLNVLRPQVIAITASQVSASLVRVEATVKQVGREGWFATHTAFYDISGDGSIVVDNAVVPQGKRIPLARLGVRMRMDKRLDQFSYLGRGPMENYPDRERGSDVGLYSSSVKEQLTPYSKPMECGNHGDVRWAAIRGSKLPGLLAQSDGKLLQVSALPYTDEELDGPEYSINLPPSVATVVTLDVATLGVGSNSCGPRPLDKYVPWSDPTAFSYVLRLVPAGHQDWDSTGRLPILKDRKMPSLDAAPVSVNAAATKVQ